MAESWFTFFLMKYLINWTFADQCLTAVFSSVRSVFPERTYTPGIIFTMKVLCSFKFHMACTQTRQLVACEADLY